LDILSDISTLETFTSTGTVINIQSLCDNQLCTETFDVFSPAVALETMIVLAIMDYGVNASMNSNRGSHSDFLSRQCDPHFLFLQISKMCLPI
jgi:hypothetical protein